MARWVRTISAWVLVIFVATVVSPHFAWEAVASDAHHDDADGVGHAGADADAHPDGAPAQDHHDGHVCAGHQFGHLPIHFATVILPVLSVEHADAVSAVATLVLS